MIAAPTLIVASMISSDDMFGMRCRKMILPSRHAHEARGQHELALAQATASCRARSAP